MPLVTSGSYLIGVYLTLSRVKILRHSLILYKFTRINFNFFLVSERPFKLTCLRDITIPAEADVEEEEQEELVQGKRFSTAAKEYILEEMHAFSKKMLQKLVKLGLDRDALCINPEYRLSPRVCVCSMRDCCCSLFTPYLHRIPLDKEKRRLMLRGKFHRINCDLPEIFI